MSLNNGPQWMQRLMAQLQPGGSPLGGTGGIAGGGTYPPWRTPGINPNAPLPGPGGSQPRFPGPAWLQKMAGGMNRFADAQLPGASPYLTGDENAAAQKQQRMAMAGALLQGAGPQPVGTSSPLGAFGNAIQAGQQAGAAATSDAIRMRLAQSQLQNAQSGASSSSLADFAQAKKDGYAGTYMDYKREFEGREANKPANERLWEVYKSLTPEERPQFMEILRGGSVQTVGQVPVYIAPGGPANPPTPLSTLEKEEDARRRIAAAAAEGTAAGGAQGTAQSSLPRVEQTAQTALETVRQLRSHPGRQIATGGSRVLQSQMVPGTPAYDFEVLLKQASGQVFLNAYEQLKGGGVITEIEGQKAEQAIGRMDAAQSEQAFLDALTEYEGIINRGVQTARRRAGMTDEPQSSTPDFRNMSDEELRRLAGGQ